MWVFVGGVIGGIGIGVILEFLWERWCWYCLWEQCTWYGKKRSSK